MKLICLPYAGGASYAFRPWSAYFSKQIELVPVEYAGRGRRFGETFWTSIDEAVYDIFHQVESQVACNEYAIFGHSMGSVLAFELAHLLSNCGKRPYHLIFSGSHPPNMPKATAPLHKMEDDKLLDELVKLGGFPDEFLGNRDAVALFLPILKSDFSILESYQYHKKPKRLLCDISVFYGEDDTKTDSTVLRKWECVTEGQTRIYKFTGNHFFIFQNAAEVVKAINEILR